MKETPVTFLFLYFMDYEIELRFQKLKSGLEEKFGDGLDLQAILFLIGVNELGEGYRNFSKNEKTDLLHIAICTLLEPYGYYQFEGRDKENWPHFSLVQNLPPLEHKEQQHLIKSSMLDYFVRNDYFTEEELSPTTTENKTDV
ncbi:MAG: hypothetical protein RIT43_1609 [Bacteroidota bacterium]|jgi:hypothetical protein